MTEPTPETIDRIVAGVREAADRVAAQSGTCPRCLDSQTNYTTCPDGLRHTPVTLLSEGGQ